MKVNKGLYLILAGIIVWNILVLIFSILFGYPLLKNGIFQHVLFDRPEFSHISDTILSSINIITSVLVIVGTILPFSLLLIRNTYVKNNLAIIACLALMPFAIRLVIGSLAPSPLYAGGKVKGEYQIREYLFRNGKKQKWISEKPFKSYKSQERIKWLPYNDENK